MCLSSGTQDEALPSQQFSMDRRERMLPQGDDDFLKDLLRRHLDAHHHLSLGARESQRNRHVALNHDELLGVHDRDRTESGAARFSVRIVGHHETHGTGNFQCDIREAEMRSCTSCKWLETIPSIGAALRPAKISTRKRTGSSAPTRLLSVGGGAHSWFSEVYTHEFARSSVSEQQLEREPRHSNPLRAHLDRIAGMRGWSSAPGNLARGVTFSSKVEILVFSDGPDDGTDD